MNEPSSTLLAEVCTALQEQIAGLYYISESEYPFEVVSLFPAGKESLTLPDVLHLAGQPAGTFIETRPLTDFFRNRTQVNPEADAEAARLAEGLRHLQEYLEQHLQGVKLYRIGRRKITALILGQLPEQGFAGLKTWVIET
jgi:hypothetical protein